MDGLKRCFAGCVVLFVGLILFVGCGGQAEEETVPGTDEATMQEGEGTLGPDLDPAIRLEVEQALGTFATVASGMTDRDTDKVFAMLQTYMRENPQIYGAAFAFAPEDNGGVKSAPYVFRQGDTLVEKNLIDSYDYTAPEQMWYVTPVETKAPVWTDPYFDEGGGDVWMVTYAIPVYTTADALELIGVVTSDVLIPEPSANDQ
ncbi:MAG TPA: cache domain-containing protein [Rhodothermales bacterium]|nr:cache domain-containing protein [Rhodothermales bacterium]